MRAENNNLRLITLDKIRDLIAKHTEIEDFEHHDIEEFNFYQN